ncbi:GntR family transcriptional regulator [Sphaerisporangium dianthi]|uniref:GntR family transcriptional regulator n=1 Tax=Sphaerisporangium dianthi TaxID=1436120 RepID=A0ABV9CS59_9ACTN
MRLSIDLSSTVPLFDQIAEGLRRELTRGALQPGDHLPPARDLAISLRVNLHTVLRAYALLRDEGLVEVRRGRGTVVLSPVTQSGDPRLNKAIINVVSEARRVGISGEELGNLVVNAFRNGIGYDTISDY